MARKLFLAESLERRVLLSAPVITGVNPDPVDLYTAPLTVHFVINGSNFNLSPNTPSKLHNVILTTPQGAAEQELAYVDATNSNSTRIVLNTPDFSPNLNDGGANITPGQWTVQVINSNGSASGKFGFDVTRYDFPPVITGVTPNPLTDTSSDTPLTIVGSNFQFDDNSLANNTVADVTLYLPNGAIFNNLQDSSYPAVDVTTSTDTELNINRIDLLSLYGECQVQVTNPSGEVSNLFSFSATGPQAPVISAQPQGQNATVGQDVTFFANASANTRFYYQWEYDGVFITNATLSALTLSNVTTSQAGEYQVIVSDAAGKVTSDPAFLSVTPNPIITTQPKDQTVMAGSNATFSVAANSTSTLSYQWQFNGKDLPGDTSSTLTLTNVTAAQAGSYDAVVTNTGGSVTSNPATLTVTAAPLPPTITTQPLSQTVTTGATVAFSVSASSTIPLNYQWQFNGSNLSGDTNPTLTLTNVQAAQAGAYTVVVSNAYGSVTSNPATLAISATPQPPNIFAQPMSQTVTIGDNVTFSVSASSSVALQYQWQFNGANLSGDTNSTLVLTNVAIAQAGTYTVVVSNSVGSANSAAATLTVVQPGTLPTITTQPLSKTVTTGGSITFSVSASSLSALSYQWQFDGADLTGDTDSSLALTNVTAADAGAYTVVASNTVGSITSTAATLTVNPAVSAPSSPLSFALSSPAAAVTVGKHGKSVLTITNTTGQTLKQTLSIGLLLSSDDTLAGQIAALLSTSKKINLKAGRSKSFTLSFKVPAVAAGNYGLLAQIAGGAVVAPSSVSVQAPAAKK